MCTTAAYMLINACETIKPIIFNVLETSIVIVTTLSSEAKTLT